MRVKVGPVGFRPRRFDTRACRPKLSVTRKELSDVTLRCLRVNVPIVPEHRLSRQWPCWWSPAGE